VPIDFERVANAVCPPTLGQAEDLYNRVAAAMGGGST
jgi:hypothetical protein